MTIKKKLYLAYGVMLLLAMCMGITSITLFSNLSTTIHELTGPDMTKLVLAGAINTISAEMLSEERGMQLRAMQGDNETVLKYAAAYEKSSEDLKNAVDQCRPLLVDSAAIGLLAQLDDARGKASIKYAEFHNAISEAKLDVSYEIYKSLVPLMNSLSDAGARLLRNEQSRMAQATGTTVGQVFRGHSIMMVLMLLSTAVGAVVVWIIKHLDGQLRQSITELSEGAEQVASAASQVSSSSQSLARDTSEQAAMIEETSASSEEINSMAKRSSENSRSAADLVTALQHGMNETNLALADTVKAMDAIGESSDKIAAILSVIDKIAFQTNILALNAAVEAARAGEAGMGFAVVADEVRNLAQRCAQAAQDTSALIEHSIHSSNNGKAKVKQVADAGRQVTEEFTKVKTLVDEINVGSQEQGRGVDQISRAITQMEQSTQKSAANAEESAAAAEELTAQSETLQEIAERLSNMIGAIQTPAGQLGHRRAVHSSRDREPAVSFKLHQTAPPSARASVSHEPVAERRQISIPASTSKVTKGNFPLEAEFQEF
ncbi:MAG TPA: methyl-accepting chemotaxis protein [Acidobacteriaceae bacterium]